MNIAALGGFRKRLASRVVFMMRHLDPTRTAPVFSSSGRANTIECVYVINLDRQPRRWSHIKRELRRFKDAEGQPLTSVTRRFSAVDARYLEDLYPDDRALLPLLQPHFTLADQLAIQPNAALPLDDAARAHKIPMSPQEIAVALSHIEVWKRIATGEAQTVLVLEDDVYMPFGFARALRAAWADLCPTDPTKPNFDLLYLSYDNVGSSAASTRLRSGSVRRRHGPGLWQASGYVLTRTGARSLLRLLPMKGPVDVWLNFLTDDLRVAMTSKSIIKQRVDVPSGNSYSILPVLSQLGVITSEKSMLPPSPKRRGPVIISGPPGSGLTAIATALSMLGYTCLSDADNMPAADLAAIMSGRKGATFNAFANIASLDQTTLRQIAEANSKAVFIATTLNTHPRSIRSDRTLVLPPDQKDKWAVLADFLGLEYPAFPFPADEDQDHQPLTPAPQVRNPNARRLRWDTSPWVIDGAPDWRLEPLPLQKVPPITPRFSWRAGDPIPSERWRLRGDTFPSNLSLFRPENFENHPDGATLHLTSTPNPVRDYASAALASTYHYRYGRFSAVMRASGDSGLITGFFLHRNGPRQEIDIEILGRNPRQMLINVFYNPGPAGSKLEYGYRGTPEVIDLGFDASKDFHTYEINWQPTRIDWNVDGETVHTRTRWCPTPIPDQPLELNFNLWHSRSVEFAGTLDGTCIPAAATLRRVAVVSHPSGRAPSGQKEVSAHRET